MKMMDTLLNTYFIYMIQNDSSSSWKLELEIETFTFQNSAKTHVRDAWNSLTPNLPFHYIKKQITGRKYYSFLKFKLTADPKSLSFKKRFVPDSLILFEYFAHNQSFFVNLIIDF